MAPREFDVHSEWLTVYQLSTAPCKVALCVSLWLDSRSLNERGQGGSGQRLSQGRLMRTLGGSLREKKKIREEEEEEEEE